MKVSCCIINYNHAQYLPTQLDGILLQTRMPDEVIFLDDGSTDDSWDVADTYIPYLDEVTNSNFSMVGNQGNCGICFSANKAAKLAEHELFYGGCSNDMLLPEFFEKSVMAHEKYPDSAITFSDPSHFTESWVDPKSMDLGDRIRRINPAETRTVLKTSLFMSGFTCVYKRDLWNQYGGLREEFAHHSDWLLNIILATRFPVTYVPGPIARTRYTGKGYADLAVNDETKQIPVLDKIAEFCRINENGDILDFILETDSWRWLGKFGPYLKEKLKC